MKIQNEGCQPHLYEQIETAVSEVGWIIPPWLEFLYVKFDPDDRGTVRIEVLEEYRTAHLHVCCGWAKVREDERSRWVLHELLHLHTNHLYTVFHNLLNATVEEGSALYLWASDESRRAVERCTNDLEKVIYDAIAR